MDTSSIQNVVLETYRRRTPRSAALHERATGHFPGGVTRSVMTYQPHPTYMAGGRGCEVTDVDGNRYLDFVNNFSSLIHGHAHPDVVAALAEQAARGTDFGGPTESQIILAEMLRDRLPSLERLRFTNSGTEAVLYAVRAARAFTGRPAILKMEGGYHGGYDSVLVSVDPGMDPPPWPTGRASGPGLPESLDRDTLVTPLNDLETARDLIMRHRERLAAVIVEPVTIRGAMVAEDSFLRGLRDATREADVLLIVDEVVTFRLARGGAQELAGVRPDITTLGKIIGGGLPVGAFGGRADVLARFDPHGEDPVHHSGTFSGNPLTISASIAALDLLTAEEIDRINVMGDRFRSEVAAIMERADIPACVTGRGSLIGVHFSDVPVRDYRSLMRSHREANKILHLALLNRGVFSRASGAYYLSTAMREQDIGNALETVESVVAEIGPVLIDLPIIQR